jgi:hypothetical protein
MPTAAKSSVAIEKSLAGMPGPAHRSEAFSLHPQLICRRSHRHAGFILKYQLACLKFRLDLAQIS